MRRAPLPLAVVEPPPPPTVLGGVSTRVRRFVYRAIEPLDRGDFRWEFLVPWLKEGDELTRREEATVGATFVVAALAVQLAVDPQSSVTDNLSFIFFFLAAAA